MRVLTASEYPARLRAICDPPPRLFMAGMLTDADDDAVAIVGSRRAGASSRIFAERLSRELAECGLTIVSGLARGIDAAAHRGALAAGGRTIGVLGCGLDIDYPPEHGELRQQIEANGAVLTELPSGMPPLPAHFPKRNRIISGLSLGVVVIEAAHESGSLITARLAAEQGRDVFAVPGPPGARHAGSNGLIKQGAKLTETVEDVLEELLPQFSGRIGRRIRERRGAAPATPPPVEAEEARMLEVLSEDPVHVDEAIDRAGLPSSSVSAALLALEIKGFVRQLPGHFFVRI